MPIFLLIIKMEICLFESFVMNMTRLGTSFFSLAESDNKIMVTFQQKSFLSTISLTKHLQLIQSTVLYLNHV